MTLTQERQAFLESYFDTVTKMMPRKPPEGYRYGDVTVYIREQGRMTLSESFTQAERSYLAPLLDAHGAAPSKSCYQTAYRLTMLATLYPDPDMRIEYAEGYGVHGSTPIVPVLHAVMLLNGKAVDIVWRENQLIGNRVRLPQKLLARAEWNLANAAYWMVPFNAAQASTLINRAKHYGIIDDWQNHYPLLRDGVQP